jgi:hypothetical protein
MVDETNVLRGGVVDPAEFENGSWRYRVRTACIAHRRLSFVNRASRRHILEDEPMKCAECHKPMTSARA